MPCVSHHRDHFQLNAHSKFISLRYYKNYSARGILQTKSTKIKPSKLNLASRSSTKFSASNITRYTVLICMRQTKHIRSYQFTSNKTHSVYKTNNYGESLAEVSLLPVKYARWKRLTVIQGLTSLAWPGLLLARSIVKEASMATGILSASKFRGG